MKNELILTSLLLTTQITPAAMANVAIRNEINKNVQTTIFKTPLMTIKHPFRTGSVEFYAVFNIMRDNSKMDDINFGKISHKVYVEFFDSEDQKLEDFKLDDNGESGVYAELRGMDSLRKTYILWTCSSTMNCTFTAPGFIHTYLDSAEPYNVFELAIVSSEDDGHKSGRISLAFYSKEQLLK